MRYRYIFLIFLTATSFFSCTQNEQQTYASDERTDSVQLKLLIDFEGVKPTRTFTGIKVKSGTSVYQILEQVSSNDITFNFQESVFPQLGRLIVGFDSIANQNDKFWVYCLDGNLASKGVESQKVFSNGTLKWVLTSSKNPCD